MPFPVQIRVNGIVQPFLQAEELELGYTFPRRFTFSESVDHDAGSIFLSNNDFIEASSDGFRTLLFAGWLSLNQPRGVEKETIQYTAFGYEAFLNRYIHKWDNLTSFSYNIEQRLDVHKKPDDDPLGALDNAGTIRKNFYWTLGEIIIDVLEHAFGIPVEGSAIPFDHAPLPPELASLNNPPLVVTPYLQSSTHIFTWNANEILKLNWTPGQLNFTCVRLWDLLQTLVVRAGHHGIFVDPTLPLNPRFFLVDWTRTTTVPVVFGERGRQVEEPRIAVDPITGLPIIDLNTGLPQLLPAYNVVSSEGPSSDLSSVKNVIIIEGRPQILHTFFGTLTDATLKNIDGKDVANRAWTGDEGLITDGKVVAFPRNDHGDPAGPFTFEVFIPPGQPKAFVENVFNGWILRFTSGNLSRSSSNQSPIWRVVTDTSITQIIDPRTGVTESVKTLSVGSAFPETPDGGSSFRLFPPVARLQRIDGTNLGRDGLVYKVIEQRFLPLVGGDDVEKDPCVAPPSRLEQFGSQNNYGPILAMKTEDVDGRKLWIEYTATLLEHEFGNQILLPNPRYKVLLDTGIVILLEERIANALGDDPLELALLTYFELPFTVIAGPSGSAWNNYGYLSEECIADDDFVHCSRMKQDQRPEAHRWPNDDA